MLRLEEALQFLKGPDFIPAKSQPARVEFHPDMLPQTLWWAVWDGVDGDVVEQDEVTLDREHSAHRFLRSLEKAVAGFHWRW